MIEAKKQALKAAATAGWWHDKEARKLTAYCIHTNKKLVADSDYDMEKKMIAHYIAEYGDLVKPILL